MDKVHFANGATYGAVCIGRTLLTVDDYYTPPTASTRSSPNDSRRPPGESSTSTSPESTHTREPALIDVGAVEDARRLAAKVQRQQRELDAKRERIAELEAWIRQYRAIFGIDRLGDGARSKEDGVDDPVAGNEDRDESLFWNERPIGHDVEGYSGASSNGQEDSEHESTPTDGNEEARDADAESSEQDAGSSTGLSRRLRRWFS